MSFLWELIKNKVVRFKNDPITGRIDLVAGGSRAPMFDYVKPNPLYFNRFMQERPCSATFTNIGSYTRGNILMNVSTVAGSNQITWTSGNPIADAGTGAWMGVIYQGGVYRTINIVSSTGSVFTASEPLSATGIAVLFIYLPLAVEHWPICCFTQIRTRFWVSGGRFTMSILFKGVGTPRPI